MRSQMQKALEVETTAPKAVRVEKTVVTARKGRTVPHAISRGRTYRDHEADVDEAGNPRMNAIFDALSRNSKALTDQDVQQIVADGGVVSIDDLVRHLNETVIRKSLGLSMRPAVLRLVMEGIFDQIIDLAARGVGTRVPNFGTIKAVNYRGRKSRVPSTGEIIAVPPRRAIKFVAAKGVKEYLSAS